MEERRIIVRDGQERHKEPSRERESRAIIWNAHQSERIKSFLWSFSLSILSNILHLVPPPSTNHFRQSRESLRWNIPTEEARHVEQRKKTRTWKTWDAQHRARHQQQNEMYICSYMPFESRITHRETNEVDFAFVYIILVMVTSYIDMLISYA